MFFCDECKTQNGWPGIIPLSRGPCECCGKVRDCYDVPSAFLPPPSIAWDQDRERFVDADDEASDG